MVFGKQCCQIIVFGIKPWEMWQYETLFFESTERISCQILMNFLGDLQNQIFQREECRENVSILLKIIEVNDIHFKCFIPVVFVQFNKKLKKKNSVGFVQISIIVCD